MSTPATTPVTQASADGTGFGLLKDVRLARQDGADRIVFEFDGVVPGYAIAYIDLPVTSDPSGLPVQLGGSAALKISLRGASAYAAVGDTDPAYRGSNRIPGGDALQVTALVVLGDFERVMSWVAGVNARNGFRVSALDAPPRLVVDVV